MKMKSLKIAIVVALGASSLTGCMGQMATTGMVSKFNLEVVDNRYGREGMFLLLSPVYGIASMADLFIFNAVEFWTGKNPITGKSPAVVDTPMNSMIKVNGSLDKSLTEVPLQTNNVDVEKATMRQIDENTMQMDISYIDGTQKVLRGERSEDSVAFYLNDEYVTTVSNNELGNYISSVTI
ncbi:DUF3332 domain-containing protein [Vibrio kyushuensis]|uniref:DUF3332 domain-containing protein n=1 Tax=Vibrio kyushuensis TaxID=2910249 RepID=UPI003D0B19B6